MNILDFILLTPLVYFVFIGVKKGFVKRVMALIGLILGIVASVYFQPQMVGLLSKYTSGSFLTFASYLLPFLAVIFIAQVVSKALSKSLKFMSLTPINMLLGAAFGFIQGAVVSTVFAFLVVTLNSFIDSPVSELAKQSVVMPYAEEAISLSIKALGVRL